MLRDAASQFAQGSPYFDSLGRWSHLRLQCTLIWYAHSAAHDVKRSADLEAGLPSKVAAGLVDGAVRREDVDELQAVALAGREIVGVMRRRDLHRAYAKIGGQRFSTRVITFLCFDTSSSHHCQAAF